MGNQKGDKPAGGQGSSIDEVRRRAAEARAAREKEQEKAEKATKAQQRSQPAKAKPTPSASGNAGVVARARATQAERKNVADVRQTQKARHEEWARRKMPTPPAPRAAMGAGVVAATAVAAAGLSAEEQQRLQRRLEDIHKNITRLSRESELSNIYDDIGEIEQQFIAIPATLDTLRSKGYVHSGHLESRLEELDRAWDTQTRPRVESMLRERIDRLDVEMAKLDRLMNQLRQADDSRLNMAETSVKAADEIIKDAKRNLSQLYAGIKEGLSAIRTDVDAADSMMKELSESPDIQLLAAEGPLLAVKGKWERSGSKGGENDPEGVLYLTDQRLLFEQKEEKATKKFLFITTASETIHKLVLTVPTREVEDIQHRKERRGMSLGRDDLLDLVFSTKADVNRATFHLYGQSSAEWAKMLRMVRSGEIDKYRAEAFVAEMEAVAVASGSFPEFCPSCYAAVPEQSRGVLSYSCEFCGFLMSVAVE